MAPRHPFLVLQGGKFEAVKHVFKFGLEPVSHKMGLFQFFDSSLLLILDEELVTDRHLILIQFHLRFGNTDDADDVILEALDPHEGGSERTAVPYQ